MKHPAGPPSAVRDVLESVLKRVDPEQQMRAYGVWTFWNDEVGAMIARRAQPTRFRNGILFIAVATHSWMQEPQYMKEDIRARLNARLGAPLGRDISFVSGNVTVEPDVIAVKNADALPVVSETPLPLPPIADAELAAAFARVVAARARATRNPRT